MTHFYSDYTSLCEAICQHTAKYTEPLQNYPLLQINMQLLAASMYHQHCLTTPTDKPVGFSLPSVAHNCTSFSDFGYMSVNLFE